MASGAHCQTGLIASLRQAICWICEKAAVPSLCLNSARYRVTAASPALRMEIKEDTLEALYTGWFHGIPGPQPAHMYDANYSLCAGVCGSNAHSCTKTAI